MPGPALKPELKPSLTWPGWRVSPSAAASTGRGVCCGDPNLRASFVRPPHEADRPPCPQTGLDVAGWGGQQVLSRHRARPGLEHPKVGGSDGPETAALHPKHAAAVMQGTGSRRRELEPGPGVYDARTCRHVCAHVCAHAPRAGVPSWECLPTVPQTKTRRSLRTSNQIPDVGPGPGTVWTTPSAGGLEMWRPFPSWQTCQGCECPAHISSQAPTEGPRLR